MGRWWINGSDTELRIDGRVLPEAVQLSYNLQRQNLPIYGYNMRLFGRVSQGQEIVVGSLDLTHNITRPGFVRWLLHGSPAEVPAMTPFTAEDAHAALSGTPDGGVISKLKSAFWGQLPLEPDRSVPLSNINGHSAELLIYGPEVSKVSFATSERTPVQRLLINNVFFGGLGSQDSAFSSAPKTWGVQFIARSAYLA